MLLQSSLLCNIRGIHHSFGTTSASPPEPSLKWKQVHGTRVCDVASADQDCGEADAFFTTKPEAVLGVRTADCIPVLISHFEARAVAAIHSGWRGTLGHIVTRTLEALRELDPNPEHWLAAIGPGAGPCCYEVSSDLTEKFLTEFPSIQEDVVPRTRYLDLQAAIEFDLRAFGLKEIEKLARCTICTPHPRAEALGKDFLFFSYRREKNTARQYSTISIEKG